VRAALATPMDCGEILEEKPRAVEDCRQRSVTIGGQWINASLDIGEVLLLERVPLKAAKQGPPAKGHHALESPRQFMTDADIGLGGVRRGTPPLGP
jgi:hypothetical protein